MHETASVAAHGTVKTFAGAPLINGQGL